MKPSVKDHETPKRDAETERLLRQFLNTDGPKGATESYRMSSIWCSKGGMHRASTENVDVCGKCGERL